MGPGQGGACRHLAAPSVCPAGLAGEESNLGSDSGQFVISRAAPAPSAGLPPHLVSVQAGGGAG